MAARNPARKITSLVLLFVSHATARRYGVGGGFNAAHSGGRLYGDGGGYGGVGMNGFTQEKYAPRPFAFGYQAPDESGSGHFHKEQGDGSGNVQGSYGYMDSQGLYRIVDYVANKGGYRANVRTNEPGTDGKKNPADVQVDAQHPPSGVQEKYTRQVRYGAGTYGVGSHSGFPADESEYRGMGSAVYGAGGLSKMGRFADNYGSGAGGFGGNNGIGAGGFGGKYGIGAGGFGGNYGSGSLKL